MKDLYTKKKFYPFTVMQFDLCSSKVYKNINTILPNVGCISKKK